MEVRYYKTFSKSLQRDMEYKTYGNAGLGVLVFPSQNQRFYEWEDNGMIDVLAPMIETGQIHLVCCDSIDAETWSRKEGDYRERIELHERWFDYIVSELIPEVRKGDEQFVVTGCSMGGYHAANFFFRRPDLFNTLFSMSGLFYADYFFPGYNDELIYRNSPEAYLKNHNEPSLLLDTYRKKKIVLCCGQGQWEGITQASTGRLGEILDNKGIHAWVDIWGQDVFHDFVWWRKQVVYHFGKLLEQRIAA